MSIVMVFPGQGSQSIGMGRSLAQNFPAARAVFDEVDEILGQKLSRIMWEGPEQALTLTENAQPALMAVSLAAVRVLVAEFGLSISRGIGCVAGHSLGEYSALAAVDSLSLAQTARLLKLRGQAMQQAVPEGKGAMAALLGISYGDVLGLLGGVEGVCEIANDNGGGQVVISGDKTAVEACIPKALEAGAKRAILLSVSAPFHCRLMEPARQVMSEALSESEIHPPKVPVYCNVDASPTQDPEVIRSNLVGQITKTVLWRHSMERIAQGPVSCVLEVGSGRVLTGLNKRLFPGVPLYTFGGYDDVQALAPMLSKIQEVTHV